jgi:MOSC domain-containing protein YiiM
MELVSVNVGVPRTIAESAPGDPEKKDWTSAIFKDPVAGAVHLWRGNLAGDQQADLVNHGGCDKAVNAYAWEHYAHWQAELGIAHMMFGAFGENFTTRGMLEADVFIGDVYSVGGAVVQVSQPRQPCWKLARRWQVKDLAARVAESGRTGWYFRVLREGIVEAGAKIELIERPFPQWSVTAANMVMYQRKDDLEAAQELAACPALSLSWRETLRNRGVNRELKR